jgi:hypothetical protein
MTVSGGTADIEITNVRRPITARVAVRGNGPCPPFYLGFAVRDSSYAACPTLTAKLPDVHVTELDCIAISLP